MPRAKAKKSQLAPTQARRTVPLNRGIYASEPRRPAPDNRQNITITVNGSLLNTVDEFVDRAGTNRSAVFEQALLMWCQRLQEQADIAYYSNLAPADRAADESWTQITTEAAKHIWKK